MHNLTLIKEITLHKKKFQPSGREKKLKIIGGSTGRKSARIKRKKKRRRPLKSARNKNAALNRGGLLCRSSSLSVVFGRIPERRNHVFGRVHGYLITNANPELTPLTRPRRLPLRRSRIPPFISFLLYSLSLVGRKKCPFILIRRSLGSRFVASSSALPSPLDFSFRSRVCR